jgi:hypothetical protein
MLRGTLMVAVSLAVIAGWIPRGAQAGAGEVTFERDIKPIFMAYCTKCHSGWFPQRKLRLNSRENVLRGGESGPVVVPGSQEQSWLVQCLLLPKSDSRRMPPVEENKDLSIEQISLVKEWVRQGVR